MKLKIAHSLSMPIDLATSTMLIVGKRGSGKSNTGVCIAERFVAANIPFAVLDPVDVWWGLKAGAGGKSRGGLDVYVFGGAHADLPLESTAGALMADVLIEHRINAVFVLREFSNKEKARFVSSFAERLFQKNRDVLHLFCEEAHETMPQQPYKGEEEMLGRMLKLQKLGRTSGIGLTSITQRPASLNKNATTQAEVLIAHRLTGPQDRDAIIQWIKYHHVEDQKQKVLETFPLLKTGEAWIWSPDFPENKPIGLKRVIMLKAETYDSRRTPKPGERLREPKQLRAADLERIKKSMAATIERVKADDPAMLRQRIRQLEGETRRQPAAKIEKIETPVVKQKQLSALRDCTRKLEAVTNKLITVQASIDALRIKTDVVVRGLRESINQAFTKQVRTIQGEALPKVQRRIHGPTDQSIAKGPKKILAAIAQSGDTSKNQLAVLTGYRTSSRNTYIQRLRESGYIEQNGNVLRVTDAGIAALGSDYEELPKGSALREYWLHRLRGGERKILEVLCERYPSTLDKQDLDELTGYKLSSRNTFLQRLQLRKLIKISGRKVVASALLFE